MTPKLYMTEISPSCRSVLLTARILNVTVQKVEVDLGTKEQLSPNFLKINPQHTVPTLEDKGFVLWDSHAIIAYLVGKYGTDDTLYSRDIYQRALIDQRLHFESAIVSNFTRKILNPMLYENKNINLQEHEEEIMKTYALLEAFLENQNWLAGDNMTIADLSLIPSVTSLNVLVPIEENKFPKLLCYLDKAEHLPCYTENENGLNRLRCLLACRVGRCNA